jgi:hypothetical protein
MKKRTGTTNLNEQPVSPLDALVRKLDLVAVEMETKWGYGVLHGLCNAETSAKFMKVKLALDDAIRIGDYDLVKAKSESLIRGWQKMEEEAIANGHKTHPTDIWYVCSPEEGIEYIVCKHEGDSARIAAIWPDRASVIYTLADIARMIENGSLTKLGDKMKGCPEKVEKPKSWVGELLEDSIPF